MPACRNWLKEKRFFTIMREWHTEETLDTRSGLYYRVDDQPWARSAEDDTTPQGNFHGPHPSNRLTDTGWDPAEELAFLLQETMQADRVVSSSAFVPDEAGHAPDRTRRESLAEFATDLPPARSAGPGHRKARRSPVSWAGVVSFSIASLGVFLVCVVSLLSGVIAYSPLLRIAEPRAPAGMAAWWPYLIFGPWVVASLSILRAAFHQRRAANSWLIVLFFSLMAMWLCVAEADWGCTDVAAAALPTAASLACFHQLVRFITLTKPPRNPRRRRVSSPVPPSPAGNRRP
ncbi:DUF2637 domain-containing protein [Streptomyces sp. NPDC126514]|uniref:DUF2637 domain-containing protein n=1 Tax=Streptomyces sp. NPDC126514 TaxID=3155210 RepID=UPI00331F4C5B